jgi:hypothetical protein
MPVKSALKNRIQHWLTSEASCRFLERFGVYVVPAHYYSPIPDLYELLSGADHELKKFAMPGVEWDEAGHLRLMNEVFPAYRKECQFPTRPDGEHEFYSENGFFGYVSAAVMHSLIRHLKPARIIEIGAGFSTRAIASACAINGREGRTVDLKAIEPFPRTGLARLPGLTELIQEKVEDVDRQLFSTLQSNDILSIDTSHAVKTGGDVVLLYLEIVPRLAPGVVVHIHDIFLPMDYPAAWLRDRRFWTEQYLVQAFLTHSDSFEILWGQKYAETTFPEAYQGAFGGRTGDRENYNSYSLWIRRKLEF